MQSQGFIGQGWKFPPSFTAQNGLAQMSHDEQEIQESLLILLGTSQGERFMQPDYGLNLQNTLFESLNTTDRALLIDKIKRTILIHESRINLMSVSLNESLMYEGKLVVSVDYVVRANNSRFNLVYPYYLHDGTEVSPQV